MNSALSALDKTSMRIPEGHAIALDRMTKIANAVVQQPVKKGWFK